MTVATHAFDDADSSALRISVSSVKHRDRGPAGEFGRECVEKSAEGFGRRPASGMRGDERQDRNHSNLGTHGQLYKSHEVL
jgi:hypothetical protein